MLYLFCRYLHLYFMNFLTSSLCPNTTVQIPKTKSVWTSKAKQPLFVQTLLFSLILFLYLCLHKDIIDSLNRHFKVCICNTDNNI